MYICTKPTIANCTSPTYTMITSLYISLLNVRSRCVPVCYFLLKNSLLSAEIIYSVAIGVVCVLFEFLFIDDNIRNSIGLLFSKVIAS